MSIAHWLVFLSVLSLTGFFLDWLFKAQVRSPERHQIRLFFHALYKRTLRTDYRRLQLLVAEASLRSLLRILGEARVSRPFLLRALKLSAGATCILSVIATIAGNIRFSRASPSSLSIFVNYFADELTATENILFLVSVIAGNYVCDLLTLAVSIKCLQHIVRHERAFGAMALLDALVSYFLMLLVLHLGSLSGRYVSFIPYDLSIDIPTNPIGLLSSLPGNYAGFIMLPCSATSFIPVALYTLLLVALSSLKAAQWIFATVFARFSEPEADRTFFGWLATATALIIALLKTIHSLGAEE